MGEPLVHQWNMNGRVLQYNQGAVATMQCEVL